MWSDFTRAPVRLDENSKLFKTSCGSFKNCFNYSKLMYLPKEVKSVNIQPEGLDFCFR